MESIINKFRFIEFNTAHQPTESEILTAVNCKENIKQVNLSNRLKITADSATFIQMAERNLLYELEKKSGYIYFLCEGANFLSGALFEFKKDKMKSGWHYLKLVLCGFYY